MKAGKKAGIGRFLLAKAARTLLLLAGVSVFSFALLLSSPVDYSNAYAPAESNISDEQRANIIARWGLDKPPVQRYFVWLGNALTGDLGESSTFRKPVSSVIAERFAPSLALMMSAWVLSGAIGLILGVASGMRQGSLLDRAVQTFCFVLSSTPTFWVGLLLLASLALKLGLFPIGLAVPIGKAAAEVNIWERIHHLILPAFTLGMLGSSNIALHTRAKTIDILSSEYVLYAMARGEKRGELLRRHVLRNIALPALTLQFASFSELFGGSVLAENVFSYPGLGSAASAAGLNGDMALLLALAVFSALFVATGNMIANLLYGVVSPQIREGGMPA